MLSYPASIPLSTRSLNHLAGDDLVVDDRTDSLTLWIDAKFSTLPPRMRDELDAWITVLRHGTSRRRARPRITIFTLLAAAHPFLTEAIDVGTGARIAQQVQLPPVVIAAMRHLNQMVNHANGLAGSFDRALAIQTMTQLVRHGYRYELDDLCAWASTNGFTGREVERLRDIAGKALNGHRFRSQGAALRPDVVKVWEAEARGDAQE